MTEKYKPLNSGQFINFTDNFCYKCKHGRKGCKILALALRLDVIDDNYPSQLIYNKKGKPTCTSFCEWLK